MRFVRESFGAQAHDEVLGALSAQAGATFLGPVREASWEPVEHLVAYMETAKQLLAPDDEAFFKKMGLYAGHLMSQSGLRTLLGEDPEVAFGRSAVIWRSFYDVGRLEVVSSRPGEVVARICEFVPPSHSLCERITGFWEGCLDVMGVRAPSVEEQECILDGGPSCLMRVTWR